MIEVQNQLEIEPETAIAQNRCYTLARLVKTKLKLKHETNFY